MKRKIKKKYIVILLIICAITTAEIHLSTRPTWHSELKKFGSRQAARLYHYPVPPAGKWTALYTADFAKKHDLPEESISKELTETIPYIEIVSVKARKLPYKGSGYDSNLDYPDQDCFVNMLAKKNHDISLFSRRQMEQQIAAIDHAMKYMDSPLKLFNTDTLQAKYRHIDAFSEAIHSPDLIEGYDFFAVRIFRCNSIVKALKNKEIFSFTRIPRASIFGTYVKNQTKIERNENYDDPKKYIKITIPNELIKAFYNGIEVPPEPSNSNISSVAEIGRRIVMIPVVLPVLFVMMFDSSGTNNNWQKPPSPPKAWPENVPTHYKLEPND